MNLFTGIIATGLAGAGAIATPVTSARVLSTGAAIFSGGRAEFNSDIFYREAAPVVVHAIQVRRDTIRAELDNKMLKTEAEYPVSVAVSDVFRYHDACTLVVGLSSANEALTLSEHPGLNELNRALLQNNVSRLIANNPDVVDSRIIKSDGTGDADALARLGLNSGAPASASGLSSYDALLNNLIQTISRFKSSLQQAVADAKVAAAVSAGEAGMMPTISAALDGILTRASDSLSASCQTKIINAQASVISARIALANAGTSDAVNLRLDLRAKQSQVDIINLAATAYSTDVIARVASEQGKFDLALSAYQSSNPQQPMPLQTAITGIRGNLAQLLTTISAGGARQPTC